MRVHSLKIWPEPFAALRDGSKLFEWRREDDRRFDVGDLLHLREYDPELERFTGETEDRLEPYRARGPAFGIPPGWVILSALAVPDPLPPAPAAG